MTEKKTPGEDALANAGTADLAAVFRSRQVAHDLEEFAPSAYGAAAGF